MNPKEKRQLENQLLRMGLASLTDPDMIQQLADLVSGWRGDRHQFLEDLLNESDAKDRYEMYTAIAPKLKFKALSLETYECRIAERAGAAVSRRQMRVEGPRPKPVEVGGQTYMVTPPEFATQAIATLKCHQCSKAEKFVAETPVGAMIEGRKAGWIRDAGVNKELCPACLKVRANTEPHLVAQQPARA